MTYTVRTYGCQMNVHDSERIAGVLEGEGYVKSGSDDADVVVLNTCAVRENADNRFYGNLGQLLQKKNNGRIRQIAVGGCLAQKDRHKIFEKAPWVDVVFGTHNLGSLPALLRRSRHNKTAEIEIKDFLETFPSSLPVRRESNYSAWVSISVGCNNTCTFCIVPSLRGKERDRRPGDILAEISALVSEGVLEVTLLGQNVNTYGVEFGDRSAFASLLRKAGAIEGLERLKFTSPHPAAFTSDVIDAMRDTQAVLPQLHMPLQSGSDRILRAMRRSYRAGKFLKIISEARNKIPNIAITTDIIVGFPGETEEDFQDTLNLVAEVRFASAFTFQYSPRPGTPAASMPNQIPGDIVQERYERLLDLQNRIALEENRKLIGKEVELLVTVGGRKDSMLDNRYTGRTPCGRLVHFSCLHQLRPGDFATVKIIYAAPYHLIGDNALTVRRTPAGDVWIQKNDTRSAQLVSLGMPRIR
ncbi:tRNA (N6-isopentenyl adenosine(37)-C2)-methylthiotransferase MiaB [Tropheryma whipplei]|uniref:tRNA (N6-isopentenyl adenosine(37)-C2)-methylthiotransferase MiaB n=1 Tax=Tropheryma whipplei TaxID=2039 RepID=UPI000570BF2F|nr:tRNA (N6-isopentenyl adenosine(37)-C2)-methylthiotransferase MiaB [Tropheryma whipplei]